MPDFVREHYKNILLKQPSTIILVGEHGIPYSVRVFIPYSRGYKCKKRYTNLHFLNLVYNSTLKIASLYTDTILYHVIFITNCLK